RKGNVVGNIIDSEQISSVIFEQEIIAAKVEFKCQRHQKNGRSNPDEPGIECPAKRQALKVDASAGGRVREPVHQIVKMRADPVDDERKQCAGEQHPEQNVIERQLEEIKPERFAEDRVDVGSFAGGNTHSAKEADDGP